MYYYRPQRSCGQGYVFTRVCDSVNGGGGLPQCMLGYPPGADTPQSRPPLGLDPPPEQTPPWSRHPPQADTPREQTPPREADSGIRSMSGRYASYWNAFLY